MVTDDRRRIWGAVAAMAVIVVMAVWIGRWPSVAKRLWRFGGYPDLPDHVHTAVGAPLPSRSRRSSKCRSGSTRVGGDRGRAGRKSSRGSAEKPPLRAGPVSGGHGHLPAPRADGDSRRRHGGGPGPAWGLPVEAPWVPSPRGDDHDERFGAHEAREHGGAGASTGASPPGRLRPPPGRSRRVPQPSVPWPGSPGAGRKRSPVRWPSGTDSSPAGSGRRSRRTSEREADVVLGVAHSKATPWPGTLDGGACRLR